VAVVVAGVALVRGDGDDASPGRAGALRAPEDVALDGPPQQALGGLPAPAGADHVDLSRPASLGLHLPSPPAAGVAFDLADGRLLWRRSATRRRSIASLTKIMTALLSVERLRPDELVRVPRAADQIGGSRMGGLKPGRHVRAEVLLHGLLISSGNDAAVSLAMAAEGSVKAFTAVMNRRARQLGLTCTHYVDPHGLDPRDRSCARDLARLSMYAMAQPRIERIARKPYARVWPGSGRKLTLRSTNPLLRQRYPGTIGLKTGFTNPAGRCLVAVVQRGGRRIGMVLLGAPDPATDAMSLVRASVRRGVLPRAL
jgi:D-alanyl-D-alanine carboxypeptidase